MAVAITDAPVDEAIEGMAFPIVYGAGYFGINDWASAKFNKVRSEQELSDLAKRLCDMCIETDSELFKSSYPYKTEYRLNFDSFPPQFEQRKYIMVPVHNDWGNNERSLVQEHNIGTRVYTLSYGEPEKNKVYSYTKSRFFNNSR